MIVGQNNNGPIIYIYTGQGTAKLHSFVVLSQP